MINNAGHKLLYCILAAASALSVSFSVNAYAGIWLRDGGSGPAAGTVSGVTDWYWQDNDGSRLRGTWAWIDGDGNGLAECYYFNEDGHMLAGTATPDGYQVNENGAWISGGTVQVFPDPWVPGGKVYTADTVRQLTPRELNPTDPGFSPETATHSSMTDEEAHARLLDIMREYPEGTPWDESRLYVSGNRYGYGCASFIFLVQDTLYGSPARPSAFYDPDISTFRVGDHIRVRSNSHSVIVLEKHDGYILAAEADYNDKVHWGRKITQEQLNREFSYRETCY